MEEENWKLTSDLPVSDLDAGGANIQDEIKSSSSTHRENPPTYTETSTKNATSTAVTEAYIPMPSIPCNVFAGKTLGQWSIDRRRVSRSLSEKWDLAAAKINSSGFAVYVEDLISEIDKQIPAFREVPNEDSFSGILQLLRQHLTGPSFCKVQEENLQDMFSHIFSILTTEEKLSLHNYKEALYIISKNGIIAGK